MARGEPEPWAEAPTAIELEDMSGDMSKSQSLENGTAERFDTIALEDTIGDVSKCRSLENGTTENFGTTDLEDTSGDMPKSRSMEDGTASGEDPRTKEYREDFQASSCRL